MYGLTLLTVLMMVTAMQAQYWQKVDTVFSVSGVNVKSFSAPAFDDLNNDGAIDLMIGNNSDFAEFFWNNSLAFPTTFTKDTALLNSIYGGGLMGTNSDYPEFVDLDNDNDLDLVIGGYNGLIYYENTGSAASPQYAAGDTNLFSALNQEIGSDPQPVFVDIDDDGDYDLFIGIGESLLGGPTPGITMSYLNTGTASSPQFTLDNSLVAGIPDVGLNSYPTFADLDDDGDYDLLFGRDLSSLLFYVNTGDRQSPVWTNNTSLFAGVETDTYWKNPDFADLDYDGDYDLVYGTADGTMYVYRNTGSATAPSFSYYPDYFQLIKISGSGATVSLADFDGDGDNDLLSGIWTGEFIYFQNDGTNETPIFNQTSASFSSLDVGSYSTPVFIDFDGDMDYDIVSGALSGEVFLFINDNGSWVQDSSVFAGIDVGYSSIPSLADLDNDGDLDLLVGAETGSNTTFYLNDGSNNFSVDNSFFTGISFPSYGRPVLADIDNDFDFDLVIGDGWGEVYGYLNDGTPENPSWISADSIFAGIEVKQSAYPGFADLDGDTKKDMIVGEYNGNFTYFKNLFAQPIVGIDEIDEFQGAHDYRLSQNYPNPFNPSTAIRFSIPENSYVKLNVYNALGELVAQPVNEFRNAGTYRVVFNASDLPSGVYFYRIDAGSFSMTKKMLLLR